MTKLYTGIRIIFNTGGTKTKLAVSRDGQVVGEPIVFDTNQDFDLWLEDMSRNIASLRDNNQIATIGGGIAGVWDERKTKLLRSPNLTEWENRPIKKRMEEIFEVPVFLHNDVALEGLGEAIIGAGRRKRIVAFVAVGTGIGGVKIEDGKICPNVFGFEPGHQIIENDGEFGYLESFAGGAGMKRAFGKAPEDISDEEVWEAETRILAIGLHNIILLWSPEMLILSGGVMKSVKLPKLIKMIEEQMQMFPKLPQIVPGELTEKAGLYGALEYLKTASK